MKTIAIIGGGASGMMAAATILQNIDKSENNPDIKVLLFEKNNILGAKVRISGGGRCNITTGITNTKNLLTKYPRGAKFLEYAIRKFTPNSIYKRFENNGLPLQMQDDMRAFPASNKGSDVVKCFEDIFVKYPDNIDIHMKTPIDQIQKLENGQFEIYTKDDIYIVDKVIISTGGNAYSHTGSSGDGYNLAANLGHSVSKLYPSLNSFLLSEDNIYKTLQGLSYDCNITFVNNNGNCKINGSVLWTHFGISGPVTFALASEIADIELKSKYPYNIYISYLNHDYEYWKSNIESYILQNPKKQTKTILGNFVPEKLSIVICDIIGIDGLMIGSQLSKNHKQYIYKLLSDGICVTVADRRPGDEFVTAGGVNTDKINPQTMESLLCPGVYFVGEIVDVDGYTGGFNLTACWASGRLAGLSV